jgi:MipA family protein
VNRCHAGARLLRATLAPLAVLAITAAQAQEMGPPPDGPMRGNFEGTLGLAALHGPVYLGSDQTRTRALPIFGARWSNGAFAGIGGIGWRFRVAESLSAGVRLGADFGRKEDRADALRGMGDIDPRAELGLFANWRLGGLVNLGTQVRMGSGEHRSGALADLSLRGLLPLGGGHRLMGGVTSTYANSPSMRSLFGVDAAQSSRTGYAVFNPEAGWRDVAVNVGWGMNTGASSSLLFNVTHRTLLGDAKLSPITRRSSGTGAVLGWIWRFD